MTLPEDSLTISKPQLRKETCALSLVRRLAAALDHDPDNWSDGDPLPRGWHQIFFTSDTRQSELKPDGMMSLGVDLPTIDLPRLVMGGRRTEYRSDLLIGSAITRTSTVRPVVRKIGRSGALAIVTVEHHFTSDGDPAPAIVEEQDYIFRAAAEDSVHPQPPEPPKLIPDFVVPFDPDEVLVFRYSACTFNTHRIHYDRPYSTEVERYPGIIVNGGLTTLMLTEAFKAQTGLAPRRVASRNRSVLTLGRTVRLCGSRAETGWKCWAETNEGLVLEANVK